MFGHATVGWGHLRARGFMGAPVLSLV